MFIPDLQCPFEHEKALEFCRYIKNHYKISDDNCYCVGDETDQYFGGMWKKDINAEHSFKTEFSETQKKLRPWFDLFPKLKIATSNHGTRWMRKALESDIPSLMMRKYEDLLGCPDGWIWKKHWRIETKCPMIMEHGDDYGGSHPHILAAMHNGCNTVIGHHHSLAGIEHIKTTNLNIWGMVTGSLIDFDAYAFNYARSAKKKPQLGLGLVFDSGRIPMWLPLE